MKLEDQVCNLQLAKKLKELGVEQNSLFWWVKDKFDEFDDTYSLHYQPSYRVDYSAFTVAELGEALKVSDPQVLKRYEGFGEVWFCPNKSGQASTEANARAKMLIWLIENNYIKLKG